MIAEIDRLNIDIGVLKNEPADEYHAKADHYLSSHRLADFIRCPWLYRKKLVGLIPDADSAAYLVGRASHTRILEGVEVFKAVYAFGGPINEKTGKPYGAATKAYADWAAAQGKPVLSQEQVDLIEQMAAGVAMNDEAVGLLSRGRAEGVLRADYCGTPCQIRIDWLNPRRGIVDLKTCDDLTWFEADARRYGYHRQAAFYQAVLAEAIGKDVPVHLVAVEKREPFRCGVWAFGEATLEQARIENEHAIRHLLACRALDDWPTGYEEVRVLEVQ